MTTTTLFNQATPGGTPTSGAGNNGTNGLHFTVSSSCTLGGIWHYSPATSTQLPTSIALYTTQASPTSGTLVTSQTASWSGAAGSGWVFAAFTSPPSLVSGTNYMAANFRNDATNEWFVFYPVTWPVTNGILTAPLDTGTGQGWYNIGTTLAMTLTQSGTAGSNFGMDVSVTSGGTNVNVSLTVAQVTETAFSPGSSSTPALTTGQVSEASLPPTPRVSVPLTTAQVNETAFSLSPVFAGSVSLTTGQVNEAALPVAPAVGVVVSLTTGQASIAALPVTPVANVNVSLTTARVSESAFSLAPVYPGGSTLAVAQVTEAARPVSVAQNVSVPLTTARVTIGAQTVMPSKQQLMTLAAKSGTDIYGNPFSAGLHFYGPNGSYSALVNNGTQPSLSFRPPNATHLTNSPQVFSFGGNSGAVNEFQWLVVTSGKETSNDDAAIQFTSESADATIPAQLIFEFGGTVAATLTKASYFQSDTWHNMTLSNGWSLGSGAIARYKLMPDNTVTVHATNLIPGTLTPNTVLWSIPSAYQPASSATQNFVVYWTVGTGSTPALKETPMVYINGSSMQIGTYPSNLASTSFVIRYALD